MSYSSVNIGTTATQILGDNSARLSLIITNSSITTNIYIGEDASITTANGILIVPNGSFSEDSGGTKMYCGPFWGICSTGTVDVRVWERTR